MQMKLSIFIPVRGESRDLFSCSRLTLVKFRWPKGLWVVPVVGSPRLCSPLTDSLDF